MKDFFSSALILIFIFILQSCSGDNTATLETRADFPVAADDITKLLGVIDRKFFEENFKETWENIGVFAYFRNELRLLPINLIPSQHRQTAPDSITLRFNKDLSSASPDFDGSLYVAHYKLNLPCTKKLTPFEDHDNDDIPASLQWKTTCKYNEDFKYADHTVRSGEEYDVDIADRDDSDPFSSYQQNIIYRISHLRQSKFNNFVNAWQYAVPAMSWVSTLNEKINAIKNADLNYSISLDRTRRSITGDGRKSGVGLRVNVNALPKIVKRHERVERINSGDFSEEYERDFEDLTIEGNFQIADGFVQFVIDEKVWNLKISSTPVYYQYYPRKKRDYDRQKIDPERKCGENFARGSIFLEDIAGNKFEFRYSQKALDLPNEQNPGQCDVEYFFNDEAVKLK